MIWRTSRKVNRRKVDYATGAAFAKDNNMLFFETSALENKNIDLALFEKFAILQEWFANIS